MSMSLNRVNLIGNLGRDPEIRTMQNGDRVATLSVATGEQWTDRRTGEKRERTEWHKVVIFNQGLVNLAANFLKKGSKVWLEGQLQTRKWTDNGVDKYITEIVLQPYTGKLIMLDGRNDDQAGDDYGQDHADGYHNG